jgi:uncharacterized protein YndB with AHSA1/START domain
MWEYEHAVETSAEPAAVWRLWTDVAGWGRWNADIERVRLTGGFVPGGEIEMTPRGQDAVVLRLAEVRPDELFVDEADLGDVVVRTEHRIEPAADGRIRVVYRTQITGPAADAMGPAIGPAITADFPETIAALVKLAEG